MIALRVIPRGYREVEIEFFTSELEAGEELVEQIAQVVPVGPTRFIRRPTLIETETLDDDLYRITARCAVAVGREWLAEEFLPALLKERAAEGLLVHGPIITYVDEQASHSFARAMGRRDGPTDAAPLAAATLVVDVAVPPRDHEAAAAIRQAMIAKANASCRPVRNGSAIRCGKKLRPLSAAICCVRQVREHVRRDEVRDRVVAEERGEEHGDGRQVADLRGGRGGDAVGLEAGAERVGEGRRQADDHQREEDPDREHLGRVLEGLVHAAARAAILRRQAVHHAGAVG